MPLYIRPSDTAYGTSWNGSLLAPTQNAVYDKIETLPSGKATTLISTSYDDVARVGNAGTNDATTSIGTGGMTIASTINQNAGKTLKIFKLGALCVSGQNYIVTFTFSVNGAGTGCRYFLGLQHNGDTISIADTGFTTDTALVMGVKGVGDGSTIDWTSINADGAGTETSNAFITNQTSGASTSVQIEVTGTTSIKFYNNGTLVNTHTTNLPTNGGDASWSLIVGSANNGAGTAQLEVTSASIVQFL